MLTNLWSFLQDESNRAVLAWIGGGLVVVAGGIWTIFKFMVSDRRPKDKPVSTVTATDGSVAAGRDIRGSKIDVRAVKKQ